jgi:division protein CdvB (Snf7/Vps24/ESCRT-III family)
LNDRRQKEATSLEKQEHKIIFFQDSEMQDAIREFNQAESMFDNAQNTYRMEEAGFRIQAAQKRIEAIRHERGDLFVETLVGEPQKKQAVQA